MRLRKVKPHKLASVAAVIARRIESPIHGTVRRVHLRIVRDTDTGGRFVQHIGVQKEALVGRIAAIVSHAIHGIFPPRLVHSVGII